MSGLHVVKHDDVCTIRYSSPLAREIGRFIVTWANFENYVQTIIWGTLDLAHGEAALPFASRA